MLSPCDVPTTGRSRQQIGGVPWHSPPSLTDRAAPCASQRSSRYPHRLARACAPVAAGLPTTRYVDDSDPSCGPDAYTTIQAAIDASAPATPSWSAPASTSAASSSHRTAPDDLTIRAVDPWTADIVAPDGPVRQQLDRRRRRQRHAHPVARGRGPDRGSCGQVLTLICVVDAPDTSIRANHLGARGTDTLGDSCGFVTASTSRAATARSRLEPHHRLPGHRHRRQRLRRRRRPRQLGPLPPRRRASERLQHALGIRVGNSPNARVARNVARSLPSAGSTTPRLGRRDRGPGRPTTRGSS